MGAIFRPKYKDRHGIIRESDVWWVRFRQHGKTVGESTETDNERQAQTFLQAREGKVALNIPVVPRADRLTHLLAHFGEQARSCGPSASAIADQMRSPTGN